MESSSLLKSSSEAFTIANSPDIASCPASMEASSADSASDSPLNPSLRSRMTSFSVFIDPSESVRETPKASIAIRTSFVGLVSLLIMERSAVPAWELLIPALAMRPIAMAVSSAVYPRAPATGATYLNVSPIMPTLVFALEDACARISAKCEAFGISLRIPFSITFDVPSAAKPKAVMASVTISEVVAKSSPDAAARCMMPSMPFSISSVFQPAIAIYSNAAADSVAENFVEAPISFAFSVRSARSFPDAPDIAATFDIPLSKSDPTLMAAAPSPPIAAAAPFIMSAVACIPFCAISPIAFIPFWNPLESIRVSNFKVPSLAKVPTSLSRSEILGS